MTNDNADQISKKVVANAAKAKISLTPEAYRLWYTYFAGNNIELIADIKETLDSGKVFTPKVTKTLYEKYFPSKNCTETMDQINQETQTLISSIFSELQQADKTTCDFGDKMHTYTHQIKTAKNVTGVKHTMQEMVQDIAHMISSSRQLQEKLNEATKQTKKLKKQLQQTEQQASIDALTGIANRKSFDEKIDELFREFKKTGAIFSAIFVDIDFFKKFNDDYGHKVGDLVLKSVAGTLHRGVKGADFPARYGGEEFIVLLPETTLDNARIVAEQLRICVSVKKPSNPETGEVYSRITASFGVSQVARSDSPAGMVDRADKALYLAKKSGRNNVKTELELG